MPRTSLRYELKVSSGISWACTCPWASSPCMQLVWNVLVYNVWLPKGEEEKLRRGKGTGPLNSWEVASASGGGACNNMGGVTTWLSAFVHLCYQEQPSEPRSFLFMGQPPFCPPWLSQAACSLLLECMRHVPRCWGWGAATVLRAEMDQNSLQCILQAFTWKSQAFNRLQSYRIIASDSASAITV